MARILLVEDDALALRATAMLLSDLGHEVEKAGSLREAQEAVAFGGFDLLVVDLKLPDGSGEELLTIDAPALVLSGYIEPGRHPFQPGRVEFMTKPAEPEVLAAAVERLYRRASQGPAPQGRLDA